MNYIGKNKFIVVVLLLLVVSVGYLKVLDTNNKNVLSSFSPNKSDNLVVENEKILVLEDEILELKKQITGYENEMAILLKNMEIKERVSAEYEKNIDTDNSTVDINNFFIQAKLVREQDRSKQKTILTDLINNDNIDDEQKAKSANEMISVQERMEKESASEAMLKAKGFNDCYVRLDEQSADVVLGKRVLSDSEMAIVEDIITRKTGMELDQIRISIIKE